MRRTNRTLPGFGRAQHAYDFGESYCQDFKLADETFHYRAGQPVDELALAEIKSADPREAAARHRQGRRDGDQARLVHGSSPCAARPHHPPLAEPPIARALAQGRKRVYYLSLEFLIGRLFTTSLGNLRPDRRRRIGARRSRRRSRPAAVGRARRRARQWRPRPARRLLHGKHGDASASRPAATASAMITACSVRSSRMAGSRNIRRNGCPSAIPGNSSARRSSTTSISAAGSRRSHPRKGRPRSCLASGRDVEAVAYDTPIVGWRGRHVNPLRLWSARAADPMRLDVFNQRRPCRRAAPSRRAPRRSPRSSIRAIDSPAGRELRLRQEYFFVSASLQDLVQRHLALRRRSAALPDRPRSSSTTPIPSIAIAELMRILVDLHNFRWDEAWKITVDTCSYTNHTLLPEALETWPVALFERAAAAASADHLPDQRRAIWRPPSTRSDRRRRLPLPRSR